MFEVGGGGVGHNEKNYSPAFGEKKKIGQKDTKQKEKERGGGVLGGGGGGVGCVS